MSIYEELIQEGIEKGIEKGKIEVIKRMLNTGKFSIKEIAAITDVSEELIKEAVDLK